MGAYAPGVGADMGTPRGVGMNGGLSPRSLAAMRRCLSEVSPEMVNVRSPTSIKLETQQIMVLNCSILTLESKSLLCGLDGSAVKVNASDRLHGRHRLSDKHVLINISKTTYVTKKH